MSARTLHWHFLHRGYYRAEQGDHEYVVRTRPLNDGWMAIADEHVIGTGLSLLAAKTMCEEAHGEVAP